MLADAVINLIRKRGSALTLTRTVGAAFNPATNSISGGTVATFTLQGVFINYLQEHIDGSVVRIGDRRLLVSPEGSTTVPARGDVVEGMKIEDVRVYAPNGVAIAWACQTRS